VPDQPMRGVFPILLTPFDEQDRIDEDGLRSVVEYAVRSGVHGVGIALGSEMPKLVERERELVIRIVVDQARGRVPVVVNTGAQANYPAVVYSQQAEELGASAVMCIPPSPATPNETRSYFRAISDAVSVPIFVQDVATASVSAAVIRQIAEESERVRYAKMESPPQPVKVAEAVAGHHLWRRQRDVPDRGAPARVGRDDAVPHAAPGVRRGVGPLPGGRPRRRARRVRSPDPAALARVVDGRAAWPPRA